MTRCPKCGSSRVETYMMPYGPMWCLDCDFRVEDKAAAPNPFLDDRDIEAAGRKPAPQSLGQALLRVSRARRKPRAKKRPA